MRWVAGAVPVVILLAGCSASQHGSGRDRPLRFVDGSAVPANATRTADVDLDEEHGAILALVTDGDLVPIAGANATLSDGRKARSDDSGVFAFDRLRPDVYIVNITAAGFHSSRGTVRVEAGETSPLKVVLQPRFVPTPYNETFPFEAFFQVWAGVVSYNVEVVYGLAVKDSGLQCRCVYRFDTAANATQLVFEAKWDSTVADPGALQELGWEVHEVATAAGRWDAQGGCNNPCREVIDLPVNRTSQTLQVRLLGPNLYVMQQQGVHVASTVFYHLPAPEGWAFL